MAVDRAKRRIAERDPRAGAAVIRWTRVGWGFGFGTCLVALVGTVLAGTSTVEAADRSTVAVVVALMLLLFSGGLCSLVLLLKAVPTPDEAIREDLSSVVQSFVTFGVYVPLVAMLFSTLLLGGVWWVVRLLGAVVLVVVGLSSLPPVRAGRYRPAHGRRGRLLAPWLAVWFGRHAPLWVGLLTFGGTLAITVASAVRGIGLYVLAVIGALLCGLGTGLGAVHQRRRASRDPAEPDPLAARRSRA